MIPQSRMRSDNGMLGFLSQVDIGDIPDGVKFHKQLSSTLVVRIYLPSNVS